MQLRQVVIELRERGIEKTVLAQALEDLRHEVGEQDEDVVLEVLDFLAGFCSSHLRID